MLIDIHTHRPTTARTIRTAGIHPWRADETDARLEAELETLEAAAAAGSIDAVGEIGLDHACTADRGRQAALFERQLAIAERHRLPVVLHVVRAFEEVMHALRRHRLAAVILHGFIGSAQQAERALSAGCCLSFGERSCRSPRTVEALRITPSDRLFIETDESEIPIEAICAQVAALRGTTPGALAEAVAANHEKLFGKQ